MYLEYLETDVITPLLLETEELEIAADVCHERADSLEVQVDLLFQRNLDLINTSNGNAEVASITKGQELEARLSLDEALQQNKKIKKQRNKNRGLVVILGAATAYFAGSSFGIW